MQTTQMEQLITKGMNMSEERTILSQDVNYIKITNNQCGLSNANFKGVHFDAITPDGTVAPRTDNEYSET